MRDFFEVWPLGQRLHALGHLDRLLPVLFLLEDLQQEAQRLQLEGTAVEASEQFLRAVEQPGAVEILRQLEHRDLTLLGGQIRPIEQVLVHADRAIDLALPSEKIAEREVQVDGLWVDFHDLDERFDRLVRLLVEQEVESSEVGQGQRARLAQQMRDVDARGDPAQREEQRRDREQPPELEVHRNQVYPELSARRPALARSSLQRGDAPCAGD